MFEKAGWTSGCAETAWTLFPQSDFKIEGNDALRDPQRDGYLRTYEFFREGKNKAILQIPVGCGKPALPRCCPSGWPQAASW